MDGGMLDVPYKDIDAFFVEYLACIRRGQKVYVVEQKTDVFKFFVDLDWRADVALTEEQLLSVLGTMCSVVPGRCIVARAPIRVEDDDRVKSGVHIHWPDTRVSRSEALAFRTRILLELGDDPEWNERIDSSVYGGSGLRMVGSHKMPLGDPYMPWTPDAAVPESLTIEDLRDFSIKTLDEPNGQTGAMTEVSNHGPIEAYIRKYVPGQEQARIRRVGRKSVESFWVQTDSKWCENIQGAHKSNHIWFSIYGNTICQRCHDEDTCKGFVGREFILSPSIVEELTSNAAVDRTNFVSIRDFVPGHWFPQDAVGDVRTTGSPIFGSRPRGVGSVQKKHQSIRGGRGGHGRGRSHAGRGNREYT